MSDSVSGSRLRRLGKMVWMSRKAVPIAVARMRQRTPPAGQETETEAHVKAAEELLGTLGELKGLALKAGQMLSYMDGVVPAEVEPAFRRVLSKLQSQAPSLPWDAAAAVIAEELGSIDEHFAEIAHEPFAAASIGQVHRGRLHDGTVVAIKVQYPGISKAMSADLANMDSVKSLMRPMFGLLGAGANVKFAGSVLDEIRARMEEELDYEREASLQQRFADMFADDPLIVVPRVYPEHSARRVLCSQFEEGESLDAAADGADQALRDQWGEVLCRAVTQQIYVHGLFNADPHPGNYLFRQDGSVVLLDFGCVKEISDPIAAHIKAYTRAAIGASQSDTPEHWHTFERAIADALRLDEGDPAVAKFYRDILVAWMRPILHDEPFNFLPEFVVELNTLTMEAKREMIFGKGRRPRLPKMPPVPADYTFLNRLQWGFYSVLTRLRAQVNWYRLLPEDVRP